MFRIRRHLCWAVPATVVAALFSPAVATAAPSSPVPVSGSLDGAQHVIVVLRNQHTDISSARATVRRRVAATASDQARLVASVRSAGGTDIRQLHVINAFAATATPAEQRRLLADPAVAEVVPDRVVRLAQPDRSTPGSAAPAALSSTGCPADPAKPLLEPEALQLTHTASLDASVPSAQQLATGKGVRVAFLADGLDVDNPDFIRADGSHVFLDYQDFSGDGPLAPTSGAEAFGDASSIAAQGRRVYDLSSYVSPAHPLPAGCTIRIRGMAPDASLVGLKVFPAGGFAFNSAILAALDYAVTVDKVDVVNESFGSNQYPDTTQDPTGLFNAELVAAGITVVASSGDSGGENTIGSPASTPGVIAVGGTTSFRSYSQTTENGFQLSNGTYASNNISALSSSGFTQPGRTIDLVAPGDLGWALCSTDADLYADCVNNNSDPSAIQEFGGTSQAAPLVAGAAALVIQAYRDTHAGASPAPALVKQLLTGTATDLGLPGSEQGAGLLNSYRAVQAARSVAGSSKARSGSNLLISPAQLDLTVASGQGATQTVTVTNVGATTQTLSPTLRSAGRQVRQDNFSVTLSPLHDPTFVDQFGRSRSYRVQSFTVPSGSSRVTAAISWPNADALVRLFLLDPHGVYTAYSLPQGLGNYGFVDVHSPVAGTWHAYLFTAASTAGYTGAVRLTTTSYRPEQIGTVIPGTLTLAPGQSRALTVHIPAGTVGDIADALQLGAPGRQIAGAVPVVVRTLVSTGTSGGTFSGSFGGGNGRAGIPEPSETYAFDVPAGRKDLAVSLTVKGDIRQQIYGFLVDPNGEPVSEQTNVSLAADGSATVRSSLQFLHRAPQAGRWQIVFAVFGPVAGTATTTAYTGSVQYGLANVAVAGVPSSASTHLKAGVPVKLTVLIVNRGAAVTSYFADGRLATRTDVPLVGQNTAGYSLAPAPVAPFPAFHVPTETDSFTVRAASDRPVGFEVSPFPADHVGDLAFEGDPDVESSSFGTTPAVTVADPIVAAQTWLALPSQIGPFADTAPTATVSFTATAHTRPFDPAVTSSTGDPLLAAVQATPPAATPLRLLPRGIGKISVTVTPSGAPGSVVSGVLYVDSIDSITGSSDEVWAIPYTYTIS